MAFKVAFQHLKNSRGWGVHYILNGKNEKLIESVPKRCHGHATGLSSKVFRLNVEMVNDRKRSIRDNILVLQIILAVIKFHGKQALSFSGHRYESMYTLDDHGNFLELILLISQFDVPLILFLMRNPFWTVHQKVQSQRNYDILTLRVHWFVRTYGRTL